MCMKFDSKTIHLRKSTSPSFPSFQFTSVTLCLNVGKLQKLLNVAERDRERMFREKMLKLILWNGLV